MFKKNWGIVPIPLGVGVGRTLHIDSLLSPPGNFVILGGVDPLKFIALSWYVTVHPTKCLLMNGDRAV